MLKLLDGPSLDALEQVADEPIPGSLVVLACRVPRLASAAAEQLGRRLLGASFHRDFAVLAPSGERWLVGEVEQIARALQSLPVTRHVLVVEQAHEMDPRARDRLLLALEEPPAPATVILVVPDVALLGSTVRGRASVILTLVPAEPRAQQDALVAAGCSVSAARDAIDLAGSQADLLMPLAESSSARTALRSAVSPRWDASSPVRDAVSRVNRCAAAACAILGRDPIAFDDLEGEARVLARRLLRLLLEHRRAELAGLLGSSAAPVAAVGQALSALDVAERQLRAGVNPVLALASLAAAARPIARRA